MKEMIFIDTSAFVALNDHDNQDHDRAIKWVRSMLSETVGLCTNMIVIAETVSILKQEISFDIAKRFLQLLCKPGIQILEDNKEIQEEAWGVFLKTKDTRSITFFDCWKVSTMQYYGIMKMFSFKNSFDKLSTIRTPK